MEKLKRKILDKFKKPALASFATVTDTGKPWTRYVVALADDDLNIWIATRRASRKTVHIAHNPEVHLTLGVTDMDSAESYLQIEGRAQILTDAESKKAIWYDLLQNVFKGPDDPDYCVCKVVPYRIEYIQMKPASPPEVWKP